MSLVLDFQNETVTYAIKPFNRRYESADLPYQAPTYNIKPLVLDVQNEPPTYEIKLVEYYASSLIVSIGNT